PAGGREVTLAALIEEVLAAPCRRAVLTGGEPLESSFFAPIAQALNERGFTIEVETSGVVPPPVVPVDQWNVSLKLAHSGVAEHPRINPAAIHAFVERDAWWKFVVTQPSDVAEVLTLVERFALPRERILLMPEGIRRDELLERSLWVVDE